MNDTLKAIYETAQRVLATQRPVRAGGHLGSKPRQHHSILREVRARKRKVIRHSRRINKHRAGRRRSTKAPRR